MALLVAGLVLFLVTHLVRPFAPGLRTAGIATLGKPAWMALHGIVSLASLVMIVYGFIAARDAGGELLYTPPTFLAHLTLLLMLIASICLVAGFLPAGHIRQKLKFPILVAIRSGRWRICSPTARPIRSSSSSPSSPGRWCCASR